MAKKKFLCRIDIPIEAESPDEALKQIPAYLNCTDSLKIDIFGYLGFIRGFIKQVILQKPSDGGLIKFEKK